MDKTSLGDRMKSYERPNRLFIQPRTATIIRVDGKAFHTFTKRYKFPFSSELHESMKTAAYGLIQECQNAMLAYYQSDEISILLNDWVRFETEQWFAGNLQKICSVSAAVATACFLHSCSDQITEQDSLQSLPKFDARVFQVPRDEVCNYFIWRQQDATRNSIQMLGRTHFSHKQLHKKSTNDIQSMLIQEKDVNWNHIDTWKKRGACIVRPTDELRQTIPWIIDENIPEFTKDRNYINRHLEAEPT